MSEGTCPECYLFKRFCQCSKPVSERLPTHREVHKYCDAPELGLIPSDAFVTGFIAGWAAHKDRLPEFIEAQSSNSKPIKEEKP